MGPAPLHACTFLTHEPATLLTQLTRLAATYGGRGHTLLFALSANFPRADDLQAVVHRLTTFHHPQTPTRANTTTTTTTRGHGHGHTVGCLTDVPQGEAQLSCAVAVFDSAHCVPFRSALAGRVQPQVGRWHAFRKQSESEDELPVSATGAPDWGDDAGSGAPVDWEAVWSRSSQPSAAALLPEALQSIPPSHVSTLLSFSAPHPDALTRALSSYISKSPSSSPSTSLTLTAAPTHFITGRPVTLFLDGKIYGEGAVGVALLRDGEKDPSYRTKFVGMKRLGKAMRITSREGNMINALDDANPTRLLLSALDAAGLGATAATPLARTFKEDAQFALGVLNASGQITQTYKITAGDPAARGGSLALDAPRAPPVGSTVQFLHCPSPRGVVAPYIIPSSLLAGGTRKNVLAFVTGPAPSGSLPPSAAVGDGMYHEVITNSVVEILSKAFVAASMQGFVVAQAAAAGETRPGEEEAWTCSLPGGIGLVEWVDTSERPPIENRADNL